MVNFNLIVLVNSIKVSSCNNVIMTTLHKKIALLYEELYKNQLKSTNLVQALFFLSIM